MKLHERINCLLLGTLWTLAIVLVLDFWLNTVYNFNMFSNAHWQYVANMQATGQPIATGFYIALVVAIVLGMLGLYLLIRPRFRKIILTTQPKPTPITNTPVAHEAPIVTKVETPVTESENKPTTPTINIQPTIQRPPHLHIQTHNTVQPPKTATSNKPEPKPAKPEPKHTSELQKIFETNGYKVLSPKVISGVPMSLIALGTDEVLWLGGCEISHEQMADTILAFKSIFQETLNDIEIDINAFIINPTDTDSVDAILDFDTLDKLSSTISEHPNEPVPEQESENMDAFAGYIETVLTYLGNK